MPVQAHVDTVTSQKMSDRFAQKVETEGLVRCALCAFALDGVRCQYAATVPVSPLSVAPCPRIPVCALVTLARMSAPVNLSSDADECVVGPTQKAHLTPARAAETRI